MYKNYTILIVSCLLMAHVKAQNLVLNHSFEDYFNLPQVGAPVDSFVYNWKNPINHEGTSDYFHLDALPNSPSWSIPSNHAGYQDTCHGNAYVGIMIYREHISIPGDNYREYITGGLTTPLISNTCYRISFKYSLADYKSFFKVANFGLLFSDSIPLNNATGYPANNLNYSPQIEIMQYLNEKNDWVKVERFYLAQGGEKFVTLGNFRPNSTTVKQLIQGGNDNGYRTSYIYLDDIHVEEVSKVTLAELGLHDTILCDGDNIEFSHLLPDSSVYVWNNVYDSVNPTIDSSGLYWVDIYNGCSFVTDSVYIDLVSPNIDLGNDTTICKRELIQLGDDLQHSNAQYTWNTGDTVAFIAPTDSGTYWLRGNIAQCEASDTIMIRYHLPPTGVLESYTVADTFCLADTLYAPSSQLLDKYAWNTGAITKSIVVTESGQYEVYTENECTESTSTFDIVVESATDGLHDYNIFTPNGDGENDFFTIYEGDAEDYKLEIYNRWGRLIWETGNPTEHWDGGNVSDGVYYYHLSFTNCANEAVERKGTVEVLK